MQYLQRIKQVPISIIFFIFAFGALSVFINSNNTNAFALQQIGIEAIVERGHIYLEGSPTPGLQPLGDVFEYNGHTYAAKQPGQFLLGSIPYFFLYKLGITYQKNLTLAGGFVTLLTSVLMTALMMVLIFHIALELTKKTSYALLIACFFGFGTIIFPYSGVTHHDVYGTFFAFLGFYLLFNTYRIRKISSIISIMFAGFFLGFSLFSSMIQIANIALSGLYILAQKQWRHVLIFSLFLIIGLLPTFLFNWIVFDHPLNFYNKIGNFVDTLSVYSIQNSLDKFNFYLISPANSIIFYSPIFLISLFGFILLPPAFRIEKWLIPLAFFLLLIQLSTIQTVGHAQYGPRYLIPSIPFILIGLSGFFIKHANNIGLFLKKLNNILYTIIILLGIASIVINLPGSMIGVMYNETNKYAFTNHLIKIIEGSLPAFHFAYFGIFLVFTSFVFHYLKYSEKYKEIIYKVV